MQTKRGYEDYLRTILELLEDKEKEVRSIDISRELKISKPSVSEMLKKLVKEKLIVFSPYSKIKLTSKGEKLARKVRDRHEIIEKFAEKLKVSQAHEHAHILEHHFSEELSQKLSEFIDGKRKLEEKMPPYVS